MQASSRTVLLSAAVLAALSSCTVVLGQFDYSGTAATGGAGGMTGSSSSGSTGGGATSSSGSSSSSGSTTSSSGGTCTAPCTSDANCHLALPGPCATNKCDTAAGCCTTVPLPTGTKAPSGQQTAGDCQVVECDGTVSGLKSADDPSDVPTPAGQCDQGACAGASPSAPVQNPVAGACSAAGGKVCGDPTNASVAGRCVGCNVNTDCTDPSFPVCGTTNTCVAPTCMDGVLDGSETSKDCGGTQCSPCVDGLACLVKTDCISGVCTGKVCQKPTCNDSVANGGETDVDCGGSGTCNRCGYNKKCMAGTDCIGGICSSGACAASCKDGVQNGNETDVDCGGNVCNPCGPTKGCLMPSDCATVANGTDACTGNKCLLTCAAGFGNCGGANDCATNLNTDIANCGSCGHTCTTYCVNGSCNDPIAVSAGSLHTCAILRDGTVSCWGYDHDGELGDGMTTDSPTPKRITTLPKPATAVSAGYLNTCAILSDQSLWCWGVNSSGQLGLGNTFAKVGPQQVPGLSGVTQVSVGGQHVCAIASGGKLYCWGANFNGQLGLGNMNQTTSPTAVVASATSVTAGAASTCAVEAGTIFCWGLNTSGELGIGNNTSTTAQGGATSAGNAVALGSTSQHACGLTNVTQPVCWGSNSFGQLGNNTTTSTNVANVIPIGLTGVTQIAVGGCFSGAVTSAQTLYMWGCNQNGQIGDGTANAVGAPEKITLPSVSTVALGGNHTCAIAGGKLYCWGNNGNGQTGTQMFNTTPLPVAWP